MTYTVIDPNAAEKITANRDRLKAGSWGGTEKVCMMSALVSGATSVEDCVTRNWPEWLAKLNVRLFDVSVGADDEKSARFEFALAVAKAVQRPVDYDKAHDLFLIRRLSTGDYSVLDSLRKNQVDSGWWRDCEGAVTTVVDLLHRRIAGEDVTEEMEEAICAARAAAYEASDAAAYAAADAVRAAANAAAYEAADATAYAAAAADATAYAAACAARAAARADLIAALNEASEMTGSNDE